jgi:hypothetical protein
MSTPIDGLRKEAHERRELSRRVRRMAGGLSLPADRARLNQYADELEERAGELEHQANQEAPQESTPPLVTQQQQHQGRQQQETEAQPFKPKEQKSKN